MYCKPLDQLIAGKKPRKASIIVEYSTRKNPEYPEMLRYLIEMLTCSHRCEVFLVVAYGAHAPHSQQEHEALYGKENLARVSLIDHYSRNKEKLVSLADSRWQLILDKQERCRVGYDNHSG